MHLGTSSLQVELKLDSGHGRFPVGFPFQRIGLFSLETKVLVTATPQQVPCKCEASVQKICGPCPGEIAGASARVTEPRPPDEAHIPAGSQAGANSSP